VRSPSLRRDAAPAAVEVMPSLGSTGHAQAAITRKLREPLGQRPDGKNDSATRAESFGIDRPRCDVVRPPGRWDLELESLDLCGNEVKALLWAVRSVCARSARSDRLRVPKPHFEPQAVLEFCEERSADNLAPDRGTTLFRTTGFPGGITAGGERRGGTEG